MHEIDLRSAIESNVIKLGALEMEAHGDRILVVEDEFRSGYECQDCLGKRKIKSPEIEWLICDSCGGTGKSPVALNARCSQCNGAGKLLCGTCHGKGGVLAVPDASERRPTTGVVVSTGPKVSANITRGESVIYTSFSGHVYDLELPGDDTIVIRVIQESDILAKVSGHLELKRVRRSVAIGSAA